jgi:crotonobetainyl-CoA:carnitine CoA-transferase CaiB-like acyl-CoA transferase
VLVENFAPGVMERLNLGEEVLRDGEPAAHLRLGLGYGKTARTATTLRWT